MNTTPLNSLFLQLEKRAETSAREKLTQTFVDVGPLFTLLSTRDHQVLFGRRGTGKTHVLRYLQSMKEERGDAVAFIDIRHLGSSGGLYVDSRHPLSERATGLLVDALSAIHSALLTYFVGRADELDLSETGPAFDAFADAITEVEVVGTVESSSQVTATSAEANEQALGVSVGPARSELGLRQ